MQKIYTILIGILLIQLSLQTKLKLVAPRYDTPIELRDSIIGRSAEFGYLSYEDYRKNNFIGGITLPDNLEKNSTGCLPYNIDSPIVVVRRGQCKFYQKAEQATIAKAKFLIIVDNKKEDINSLDIVDYESGKHFPLGIVLIPNKEGEALIQEIESAKEQDNIHNVIITLDQLNLASKVQIDYWFTSLSPFSYDFFEAFLSILKHYDNVEEFNKDFIFNIHTPVAGLGDEAKEGFESPFCTQDGRYCSVDPDGKGPLTALDSLKYNVKMICILQELGFESFITFSMEFHKQCLGYDHEIKKSYSNNYTLENCFEDAIGNDGNIDQFSKTPLQVIDKCYARSQKDDGRNTILDNELKAFSESKVQGWPSLIVNNSPIHGDVRSKEEIESVLCAAFEVDSIPQFCKDDLGEMDGEGNIIPYSIETVTVLLIVGSILIFLFGLFCVRRKMQKDNQSFLQNNVNEVVDKYMRMSDNSKLEIELN